MHKFVVVKKQETQKMADIVPTKVKMSGYLKKKRNKMGGWRKLWFVLHNQLLLSYNSREEYDKKLVSFKDALNLVPGTIVRPLGSFRFTIETTTNIIYTFRCDDSKTCTLWITALIESLTMQGQCARENGVGKLSQFHVSFDNVQQGRQKKVIQSSHSWDSICRPKNVKFARIPVAQTTAKILERNGVSATDLNRIHLKDFMLEEKPLRVRNFRLHEKRLSLNQSDEVSRINQMFGRSSTCASLARNPSSIVTSARSVSATKDEQLRQLLLAQSDKFTLDLNNLDNSKQLDGVRTDQNSKDFNRNKMNEPNECSALDTELQRLCLKDSSEKDVLHGVQNRLANEPIECRNEDYLANALLEMKLYPRISASSSSLNKVEPIYAVVDLKNKYARRAKIRETEEQMERERPKSVHVVGSDYEEVLNFPHELFDRDEDDNENIYEPINIPDSSHHRHTMWKYFPRINIEALIEMTRNRRKDPKTEPPSPFADIRKKLGYHRKSIKNRMKKFYTKDTIAGVKERNAFSDDELDSQGATGSTSGTSDNSIKSSCENTEKPMTSFVLNEIEKYRRGGKQIFGSLSRLKKTRTSLCLEDGTSKKNLLAATKNACFQQELRGELTRRSGSKGIPNKSCNL